MKWNRFTLLEAGGALFCGLDAPLLFMAYRWSGGAVWAALLASVNHSAWELTKLLLVPFALWAVILFLADRPPVKRYTVAQAAGLTASAAGMLLFCHVLSVSYTHLDVYKRQSIGKASIRPMPYSRAQSATLGPTP